MQDELLTTATVADLAGKSIATVNRWAAEGLLRPEVEFPGRTGARLYRRDAVDVFLDARRGQAS